MLGSSVELVLRITKDGPFMQLYVKEKVEVGREMAEKEAMGARSCDRSCAAGEREAAPPARDRERETAAQPELIPPRV